MRKRIFSARIVPIQLDSLQIPLQQVPEPCSNHKIIVSGLVMWMMGGGILVCFGMAGRVTGRGGEGKGNTRGGLRC